MSTAASLLFLFVYCSLCQRTLFDSASEIGSPFKESWLAEGKTERLKGFLFVVNVPLERLQGKLIASLLQGGSGLVRFPLEMLSHFSPLFPARQKDGAGVFRRLRTATRDAVPGPCKPFEKGLTENFYNCFPPSPVGGG